MEHKSEQPVPSTSTAQEKCSVTLMDRQKKVKVDCGPKSATSNPQVQEEDEEESGENNMNPLLMQDTVGYVLKHLDGLSLKSCRLVSKLWNEEATKMFFKNNYARVTFDFHKNFESMSEEEQMMEMLKPIEFFCRYWNKPNIIISDLRDIKVFTQLRMLGGRVKCIKVKSGSTPQKNYIKHISELLKLCPNVTFIENEVYYDERKDTHEFELALMDMCSYNMDKRRQQLLTISDLNIDVDIILRNEDTFNLALADYEKFSDTSIRLPSLKVLMEESRIENKLIQRRILQSTNKILDSSKDVLKHLELSFYKQTSMVNSLNIPVLPKLDYLEINILMEVAENLFQPSFRFEEHVPNLRDFRLYLGSNDDDSPNLVQQLFRFYGEASSVKKLRFHRHLNLIEFQKLLDIFPFVENLSYQTNREKNFYPMWKVFSYLNLKKLLLSGVDSTDQEKCILFLTKVTGLSKKEVGKLWIISSSIDREKMRIRHVKDSIACLQNLEKLTINAGWYVPFYDEVDSKIVSILHTYAKKIMPKLTTINMKYC